MLEIRIHGRGGQGGVIASKVLAEALFREGWDVQAFPAFGVERRGRSRGEQLLNLSRPGFRFGFGTINI